MSERSYKVRCTSIEGTKNWQLTYGKGGNKLTIIAEYDTTKREYNTGNQVQGMPFVGMLREVKESWGRWAGSNYSGRARTVKTVSVTHTESTGINERLQLAIDSAETHEEAIGLFVQAYNTESVSLDAAEFLGEPRDRHHFKLPKGVVPFPTLAECYSQKRDQYVWPTRINSQTGDIECKLTSSTESESSTLPATTFTSATKSGEITRGLLAPASSLTEALAGGSAA